MCLVTGGARGLGLEFTKAFVESGCTDLAIVDLKEEEAHSTAEELVRQSCGQSLVSFVIEGRMVGRTDGRLDGQMDGRTGGRTDGWSNGRADGWMVEWTGGWMIGRMDG